MVISLLVCVLFFVLTYLAVCVVKRPKLPNSPPTCLGSLPIIGITHLFLTNTVGLWKTIKSIAENTAKQGGVTVTKIGLDTHYVVTDPEDAATLANTCFEKHYMYSYVESWFGKSLFTASVPVWKLHRKILNPAFSAPAIHGFMKNFNDQGKKLIVEMDNFVGKTPFKATSIIHDISLRGTCQAVYGMDCQRDDDFFQKYMNVVKDVMHLERLLNFWHHSDLYHKLSGRKSKPDKLIASIWEISDNIIEKSQASNNFGNNVEDRQAGERTFLNMFLKLCANNALTNTEVRQELELTLAAAFETTALVLESILILLGTYTEIQERLFKEIITVCGPENDIDKEDLHKLVYTDAVIKESLRVVPVAPVVARSVDQDVKLKTIDEVYDINENLICFGTEDCILRADSYALIMIYGINRDSSWGPDADQFRPERWLEPGGVPNVSGAFAAFSIGKRGCIGKTYAMTALKVLLAQLVRRYQIKSDYTKVQFRFDITLQAVKGTEISLKLRKIL